MQLSEEDFESAEFRNILDLCINCKACMLQCPSGVDVSRLISIARAEYVRRKGLRRTERLLSHNRYLSMSGSMFSSLSGFVMKMHSFKWFLEKAAGLDLRRDLPGFARGSFLKKGRKFLASRPPITKPVDKIAYLVDSFANYNDHELAFAVLKVLRHNNIEVILPKQLPVPLPAACYGNVKSAKKDLAFNVKHLSEAVRSGYKIICSEPSAAMCLKDDLRFFVAGEDAELVSENTFELMSYLRNLFERGKLKPSVGDLSHEYAYHCPCHLLAAGGDKVTVELLEKLCNIKVIDLKAGCCGLAGTFGMQKKNYELSTQIAANLKKALNETQISCVLTECSACKMQIEHISNIDVSHPIKVLKKAYKIDDGD